MGAAACRTHRAWFCRGVVFSLGVFTAKRRLSARFREQGELTRRGVLGGPIGKRRRIFAGKAMIGELRAGRIAALFAHRAIDSIDRKECERVGADEFAHALEIVRRGKELVALWRVDAVVVGMRD